MQKAITVCLVIVSVACGFFGYSNLKSGHALKGIGEVFLACVLLAACSWEDVDIEAIEQSVKEPR